MTPIPNYSVQMHHNTHADEARSYPTGLHSIISRAGFETAQAIITRWPNYDETPLVCMENLAQTLGVSHIWYKDESTRFGLSSFKALGGAYAVFRLLAKIIEKTAMVNKVTTEDILSGRYQDIISAITVTCATDGNHGRSVAWGAQKFGCKCVIYIHAKVSKGREEAIAAYGAEIIRTAGNYDDSVHQAQKDAETHGRFVISDTSYEGYMDVPKDVMQGYTIMAEEALTQLPQDLLPTHIFLQGGVGGMAAAIIGHMWETLGAHKPRVIIVEPEKADCLYRSACDGEPVTVTGELDTVMAGLSCGEVSLLAWDILYAGANDFMTIPDAAALDAMKLMAAAPYHVVAGESAVAGLAGFILAAQHEKLRNELGINPQSRILCFGTEGDTDPQLYEEIVGKTAAQVRAA